MAITGKETSPARGLLCHKSFAPSGHIITTFEHFPPHHIDGALHHDFNEALLKIFL